MALNQAGSSSEMYLFSCVRGDMLLSVLSQVTFTYIVNLLS